MDKSIFGQRIIVGLIGVLLLGTTVLVGLDVGIQSFAGTSPGTDIAVSQTAWRDIWINTAQDFYDQMHERLSEENNARDNNPTADDFAWATPEDALVISTASELMALGVFNTSLGALGAQWDWSVPRHIKLGADINLGIYKWTPVWLTENMIFDGPRV